MKVVPLIIVFVVVTWSISSFAQDKVANSSNEVKTLVSTFAEAHMTKPPIDEQFCKRWLNRYLNTLDPLKLYFLSDDIAEFETYSSKLPEFAVNGNMELFDLVWERYQFRVQVALAHALHRLEQEFDFTIDEHMPLRYRSWPTTNEDRIERWRLQLKYDLLLERLRSAERDDQIEFLRTRYEAILNQSECLPEQEALAVYLESFCQTFDPHSGYITRRELGWYEVGLIRRFRIGLRMRIGNGRAMILGVMPGFSAETGASRIVECELLAIRSNDGELHHFREIFPATNCSLIRYGLGQDESVTLELYDHRTQDRFAVDWPRKPLR